MLVNIRLLLVEKEQKFASSPDWPHQILKPGKEVKHFSMKTWLNTQTSCNNVTSKIKFKSLHQILHFVLRKDP